MIYIRDEQGNYTKHSNTYMFYDDNSFLRFIDNKRKEKKISLKTLGNLLGLTKSSLSRILAGKVGIKVHSLVRLLRVFKLRLALEEIYYPDDDDWLPDDDQINEMNDIDDIEELISNSPVLKDRRKKLNLDKE